MARNAPLWAGYALLKANSRWPTSQAEPVMSSSAPHGNPPNSVAHPAMDNSLRAGLDDQKADIIHWIDPTVLIPALPLGQECYAAIGLVAGLYMQWRPLEPQWESVLLGAETQRISLRALEHRHSSIARPEELNALYGHFDTFPVHCAMVGVSFMRNSLGWSGFAAIFLWPWIAPQVLGHRVNRPHDRSVKRLGQLLRDAVDGTVSAAQIEAAWAAWSSLSHSAPDKVPGIHDTGGLWRAIADHVQAYRDTDTSPFGEYLGVPRSADGSLPKIIEKAIDEERMADPESEGLSPEDANAVIYQVGDGGDDEDGSTPLLRYFRNIHAGERANQHLPLAWSRLTPPERAVLIQSIPAFGQAAQCGLALCISLALSPEQASALRIHPTYEAAAAATLTDGQWHLAVTSPSSVIGVHAVQLAALAYRRGQNCEGMLQSTDVGVVGLPDFASEFLLLAAGGLDGHLLRFVPQLARETRQAVQDLRDKTATRVTFGRIREILADDLFLTSQDECLVARTLPSSSTLSGSGIYYSAYPAVRLFQGHQSSAFQTMGWNIPQLADEVLLKLEHRHVGSELVIDPEALVVAVDSLRDRAAAKTRLGRFDLQALADAFNLHGMYTLACLSLMTSHRPTHEPFPRPSDVQPSEGLALVVDKRHFGSAEQRLVPLTFTASAQFESYLASIAATADYMDGSHPAIAGQLRSLLSDVPGHPSACLFSILELAEGKLALRPFERQDWNTLWPEWRWPLNGNRHFLMQSLNRLGLCRELANYLFGHAEPGQTAFNRHSTIAPDEYVRLTLPYLTAIEKSLGLQTIAPIKGYRHSGALRIPPTMLPIALYGDSSPQRNRRRRLSTDERKFMRGILAELQDGETTDETSLKALSQRIATQYGAAPEVANRFGLLLRRWARSKVPNEA